MRPYMFLFLASAACVSTYDTGSQWNTDHVDTWSAADLSGEKEAGNRVKGYTGEGEVSAPPAPMVLTLRNTLIGDVLRAEVQDGIPYEDVQYALSINGSSSEAGPCIEAMDGLCIDLVDPVKRLGSAYANGDGLADLAVDIPDFPYLYGTEVCIQAVARRGAGGEFSDKSNVACFMYDTDTDADGLIDSLEMDLGTDYLNADTDMDGLDDGYEYYELGTDPLLSDTDGDLVGDADDCYPLESDKDCSYVCSGYSYAAWVSPVYWGSSGTACTGYAGGVTETPDVAYPYYGTSYLWYTWSYYGDTGGSWTSYGMWYTDDPYHY